MRSAHGAGGRHTCAALRDGTARCWGLNSDLRLGATSSDRCLDGTNTSQLCALAPLAVGVLSGATQLGIGPTSYGWTATPVAVTGLP